MLGQIEALVLESYRVGSTVPNSRARCARRTGSFCRAANRDRPLTKSMFCILLKVAHDITWSAKCFCHLVGNFTAKFVFECQYKL